MTPLDEGSTRRRYIYLTATLTRDTFVPPTGFKPVMLASERPQTHTLGRAATGISPIKSSLE